MIRHIVFFSVRDPHDIPRVIQALSELKKIPESLHFEVARNEKRDALSQEIDIIVYSEFADEAALARYKQHRIYSEAIAVVRPLREQRIAVDFHAPLG